jgi:UDP-glucose 4-epimerase
MSKILVTGGCGYIGAHTITDLIGNGYDVIAVDDNSRSTIALLKGIENITRKKIQHYKVDLKNFEDTGAVFQEHKDIEGFIHFAAYKAVGESVEQPLDYYENNLLSLINLLRCVQEFQIPAFVFSSSCTVYGQPQTIPVTELSPILPAESPYGATKQMSEQIIKDFSAVNNTSTVLLRYFNPVGAHPSNQIGELPLGKPANLVPAITQTAIGKIPSLTVFGTDYTTRDGSCLRDFIHVSDIAHAHTLALQYLEQSGPTKAEVFNLGTGNGVTVLEAIKAFEKVSGISLNYTVGQRRPGDIEAIYANNTKAKTVLGWNPVYGLEEMMATAWAWEQKINEDELLNNSQQVKLN